ncbi:hypothetical protein BDZ45DRAFT_746206 [Acephala macrosclerotiorum]|nr:hypothetical protein BDZ45DRAFT_746206 [Acephala macrosclerotiorum]
MTQRGQQAVIGEYQKKITAFVEQHKGKFTGEKIPEVVVEGRMGLYWAGITDNWRSGESIRMLGWAGLKEFWLLGQERIAVGGRENKYFQDESSDTGR